jgi:hypothetical protein
LILRKEWTIGIAMEFGKQIKNAPHESQILAARHVLAARRLCVLADVLSDLA